MIKIEDGKGSGKSAGVNKENRLLVEAVSISNMAHAADDEQTAYLTYFKRNVAAADTYEALGYLQYDGTKAFHVMRVLFTTTVNASFEVYIEPTGLSGGDDVVPVNTNRGSGKTLLCTAKTGSTAISGTVASELEIACARIQAYDSFSWELEGALILPKNSVIWIQGKSGTIGAQLRATMFGYEAV